MKKATLGVLAILALSTAARAGGNGAEAPGKPKEVPGPAGQQEDEELKWLKRLAAEERQEDLEDRLKRLEEAVLKEKAEEKEVPWTDRLRIKGDLRYRHEYQNLESQDDDRHRHRIRARIGVEASLYEDLDLSLELSTAHALEAGGEEEGDPISNNRTLTDAWSAKGLWLSEAYFEWHPSAVPGLYLTGGKIKRPFVTPIQSELVWDSDVSPEGGVATFHQSFDPMEVFLQGFGFWVIERKASADAGLIGAQAGAKYHFEFLEDKAHVTAGFSYYDYLHVRGEAFFVDDDPFGNSTDVAGTLFAEDYDLFEAFIEFEFHVMEYPVAVFGDYVHNTAADRDNAGWCAGGRLGKAEHPGAWQAGYQYRRVEKDAVFGTFTDSDFGGGGTNVRGHEIFFVVQVAKSWWAGLTYFHNDRNIASGETEDEFQLVQVDVMFKF